MPLRLPPQPARLQLRVLPLGIWLKVEDGTAEPGTTLRRHRAQRRAYAVLDLIGIEVRSWFKCMQRQYSKQQLRVEVEERAHFAVRVLLADLSGRAGDERDALCGAEEHDREHLVVTASSGIAIACRHDLAHSVTRETFRRHLSQHQAVILIEVKLGYQEHQNEIGLSRAAGVAWQAVKWEDEGVYDYMKVLVKEAVTLRKNLSRCLPSSVFEGHVHCSTWRSNSNQDDEDWF
ncbi:hypothetical protein C8Q76DRAFT_800175 [Earliella scabrosa]|nr:hypothetical protein C8Q76DRAFT_800175 [Earliella scabrosa]